jgi:hypothetical protein
MVPVAKTRKQARSDSSDAEGLLNCLFLNASINISRTLIGMTVNNDRNELTQTKKPVSISCIKILYNVKNLCVNHKTEAYIYIH